MKHFQALKSLLSVCLLALALCACETDNYDKGEGAYSHMTGDLADLLADSQKRGVSFETDDGTSYTLETPTRASFITTADSTYRTSIYYNKVEGGRAKILSWSIVPTMKPLSPTDFKTQPQDPVGVESCWLSKNGKYLNLALLLKNGRDGEGHEGKHILALVEDENHKNADNTHTAYYRLLHSQNGTPEYYTNRRYFSILLPSTSRPDSVRITINTYEGTMVKTLKLN
jgi:hypothetical protein